MKKLAWITDSTCGLSKEFIEEHHIHVLPLHVIVGGVSYRENVDLSADEFYRKLKEHGEGATTSQPAFGDFIQLYERLKTEYDCAIAIHASSGLTGTYESALLAAEQTGFPVHIIDSKIGAYALGKMINNGIALEKQGKSYEEIVATMETYPDSAEMYLLPASWDQLRRSGRVTTTQALFASLLKINLLLRFQDGKVIVDEKIRSKKRAEKKFFQIILDAVEEKQLKEISVMHAGVKEQALRWKKEIETIHEQLKVKVETLVPVAGVHTGYGTLAVAWLADKKI